MNKLHLDELDSEMISYSYVDRDGKNHTNTENFYPIIKTPKELINIKTEKIDTDFSLTAAPGRHFSGRGLTRGKTLWSSFILQANEKLGLFFEKLKRNFPKFEE